MRTTRLFAYAAAKGRNIPLFSVFYKLPDHFGVGSFTFDLLNRALTLGWTRFFKHHERPDVLDDAPGPSPWYLRAGKPVVPTWGAAGESSQTAGATVLSGREGPVLILDFHNYVMLIDPDTLLVWHQRHVEPGPSARVVLRIFPVADLRRLEGELEECAARCDVRERRSFRSVRHSASFPFPLRMRVGGCD